MACYICLDEARPGEPLVLPCQCPPGSMVVHRHCLAKWQLNCAGKDEETRCRFCHAVLPDWRPALTPSTLRPTASVMSVRYRGVTYRITYTPGPDGLQHFLETLQSIGIKVASASQVTFLCRSPDTGEEMSLKGLKAFDAAAYCASITAAKRVARDADKRQRRQQQQAAAAAAALAHGLDTSPHSDHSSDMGVRPEAGPDSPRSPHCFAGRPVAHVHAEASLMPQLEDMQAAAAAVTAAGSDAASSRQAAAHLASLHSSRAHAAFYSVPAAAAAPAGAAAPPSLQQQAPLVLGRPAPAQLAQAHESWWRRALACVHVVAASSPAALRQTSRAA